MGKNMPNVTLCMNVAIKGVFRPYIIVFDPKNGHHRELKALKADKLLPPPVLFFL
jgi:hypothetical protein